MLRPPSADTYARTHLRSVHSISFSPSTIITQNFLTNTMNTSKLPAGVVFGTAMPHFRSFGEAKKMYDVLEKHKEVKELDTARGYPESERWIGELGLAKKFRTTTKAETFQSGGGRTSSNATKERIQAAAEESLKMLGVDKVYIYLLHAPDEAISWEEQMEGINELHQQGRFEKFGISNFTVSQTKAIHAAASSKSYVLPTVYQGSYSLLFRNIESDLFPTLRSLNIAFQAYSPMAGGFLAKNPEFINNPPKDSRWNPRSASGNLYQYAFNRPKLMEYLRVYTELAKETGLGQAEMAYRWARFHSALDGAKGDTLIVGATKPEQLEETLEILEKGPLEPDVVDKLQEMWEKVNDEAPHHDYFVKYLS